MSKIPLLILTFVLLLNSQFVFSGSFGQGSHEFTARWEVRSNQASSISGILKRSGEKEKRVYTSNLGKKHILLIRQDEGSGYYLDVPGKRYYKMPSDVIRRFVGDFTPYADSRVDLGETSFQGEKMKKFKIKGEIAKGSPKLGEGLRMKGYLWIDKKGIIRKSVTNISGSGMNLKIQSTVSDLQFQDQLPQAFEVPSGYEEVDLGLGKSNKSLLSIESVRKAFN